MNSKKKDKKIVFVVEDEPDGQDVVAGILSNFNIATDVVGDAEDALHLLEQHEYAAAIIDLNLPGMDGIELVRVIRDTDGIYDIPCVAITARDNSCAENWERSVPFLPTSHCWMSTPRKIMRPFCRIKGTLDSPGCTIQHRSGSVWTAHAFPH